MTFNFQTLLLAAVFASQIIVLSFYAPKRWRRYYADMFGRYPPEQYPRLYPLPRREIEAKLAIFRAIHLAVGVGAVITFVAALIYAGTPQVFVKYMSVSAVVQVVLPLCIAVPLGFRIRKAFRGMTPPSRRSAQMRHWRITDFVSPLWIGLGLVLQTLGLACATVVYAHRPNTAGRVPAALLLIAAGGAMLLMMIVRMFSPRGFTRADPYRSDADTFADRQRRYRIPFRAGVLLGAYQTFIALYNGQVFHFELVYLQAGVSVLLQLWALWLVCIEAHDFDTRDFSVYRADSPTEAVQ